LGEKGGELNSKIHSSVKKVVSVLEAQAICRHMNRNFQNVGMHRGHCNKVETRKMNDFTVLLALGEKGGELNSKIHSSVKNVVSALEAQVICRNMNRNLQKCRNASQALQ